MAVVELVTDQGVGRVTLNRPEAHNALDRPMVEALHAIVDEAIARDEVRCLLLTAAGPSFCVGADLMMVRASVGRPEPAEEAIGFVDRLHELVVRLTELPLPTVCAVHGACAGGGLGLALACDITWAGAKAHFTTAFNAIGLTPDTGTSVLLTRAVGTRMARELVFSSRRVSADEALALGLVTRALPEGTLQEAAWDMARHLASGPTTTFARSRVLIDQGARRPLAEQIEAEKAAALACLATHDMAEGVSAFLEKRRPVFRGH
jgi:2-(1,2-epoxy-1,2-dihydrophenyl)acetyl-CoA isomerase